MKKNEFSYHWPKLHKKTILSLIKVYLGGYWSWYGKNEISFIKKFSKLHNVKYAVTTVSGTTALETALLSAGIKQGDEVIVPAYTWISTATSAAKIGAIPVIVDIDPETLCISPEKAEAAITERTKAIIPVHLFSAMADMDKITEIAKKYDLKVIEDCAHAHCAQYKNKGAGSLGDAGAFSFQQTKLMCSGEGGILVTNDIKIADRADSINHIGYSIYRNTKKQLPNVIYSKYVFSEFQAAILSDQCDYIMEETMKRIENANYFESLFDDFPFVRFQKTSAGTTRRSYYYFVILLNLSKLKKNTNKYDIINDINTCGLNVLNGWGVPVWKHEVWNLTEKECRICKCSIAEYIAEKEIITIPHQFLLLDKKKLKKAANIIKRVIKKYAED